MKAIMVMFDSLNRHFLPPYGNPWVHAPNFKRLAARSATFDNCWIGSMPCMPARRELHTGRYNFLHNGWGPLEPFDESMPEILKRNGVSSHLISDHQHYWEDGGATYHHRYNTWQFHRGQEGDAWMGQVAEPEASDHLGGAWRQDVVNRAFMQSEAEMPQAKTFAAGLDFIKRNAGADRWFLQLETFDPHEPFYTQRRWKDLYPHDYDGPKFDWPPYREVTEPREAVEHVRYEYAALVSMCDAYLGDVMDMMDAHGMWDDTMLIVNTDHGFLLGEHESWAKCWLPFYNEIAHTPLFIWDPRSRVMGERRKQLVQTIDLPATLLEFFDLERPATMQGVPLGEAVADPGAATREAALFGIFGGHVNLTDGRYVYMRANATPDNGPLYAYTLMPTHMRSRFDVKELQNLELADPTPFPFMQGCRPLKVNRAGRAGVAERWGTRLYDTETDYAQTHSIDDPAQEARLAGLMAGLMAANDAPAEQFVRMGLDRP